MYDAVILKVTFTSQSQFTLYNQHQTPLSNNCNFKLTCCMLRPGADCKVSNTRMFQGQRFEGGTFKGQLVRWSVKIVRRLPSFSPLKKVEDNFFHNLLVYLSQSHSLWSERVKSKYLFANDIFFLSCIDTIYGFLQRPLWTFMKKIWGTERKDAQIYTECT